MSNPLLGVTAVVTVSYNSSTELRSFLDSVRRSEEAALTVVVADNRSADLESTTEIAAQFGARLLALPENRGYGGAINAAIASLPAEFEYVLISNPDVELQPGATSALLSEISQDGTIGAIGPRVLNADGSTYPSARRLPSLRTGVGHALLSGVWPGNPWSRSYRAESATPEARRFVGWLSGSCLLVRRTAFDELNGFDEGYFMYFEDVDLGYRLNKAGWSSLYAPQASVIHTGAHSTSADSGAMVRVHHQSAYRYLEKKYTGPMLAPLRWALRLGLAARARLTTR